MWTVLMNEWHDVVKMLECPFVKRDHGKVDFAVVKVPVKVDFDVFFPVGIYENIMISFEEDNEMNSIVL